jgi:antitoxin (DNA-binding transcriptional repressor) of toxin-antitoxin stability system
MLAILADTTCLKGALMKILPSVEVQNKFGSISNMVKAGEPVAVTQYGTPTMMILPYALATDALRAYNAQRLVQFMDAMPAASSLAPELTDDEINELVHELRP